MKLQSTNLLYHIAYWILVILVLTLVFGLSWGNNMAAFYFISMLLPIVLGTSYFFNYFLVQKFFLNKRYLQFALYTLYTLIVSLYLGTLVLMFSFIYLGNFDFQKMNPHATDIILLAVILYLLVFIGSFLLMILQIREKQELISQLIDENRKMKTGFLEIISNRKTLKIPYNDIVFIESLSDYVRVNTTEGHYTSKEKISSISSRLPDLFLRIHRSFVINKEKVRSVTYNEVEVGAVSLNIGRSYKKEVLTELREKGKISNIE